MADMRDRLAALVEEAEGMLNNDFPTPDMIADHLLANGVILPPCKVGDTVYYIAFGKVYKGECHAITLKPTMQIHIYDYDGDNASLKADRVFLTREAAEKALREKEK